MNTRFIAFLLPCIAVVQSVSAYADTVDQLLSYTCDQKADQIVLDMQSASDEAGAALIKNQGPNAWDPWSLLATGGRGGELVTGVYSVHRYAL